MAAQVEVQAGEVGRTGVGGRLHLSPLTDSSNKSLVEIPSINQSHIIAPEPNKPVPGPKPRLSPKPFSVDRNPTIKPILAPKPNPKPRPESTLPPGQKPELPRSPKQQQPAATGKPRLASTNPNLPTNTTLKTSNKLSSGQTTKPVVHPFKPAPPLIPEDPSKPISPVPTLRQRPSASSLAYAKSFKQLPAAEWSGSTNNEAEKDKMTPSKGAPSIARAKSMGSLDLVGQEEEVNKKTKPEAAVPIRPRPRGSRPRPVSAIFLDSPTKTETTPPGAHWVARRPLSADLTSKFESIGLSLHRKSPKENTKENTPEEATQPQKTQQDKTPKSVTPQITDVEAKQTVSDQSTKKTEEPTVKKHGDDDKRAVSIKKRISLLLDSSSSSSPGATGLMSDVHASGQATPETEPAVDVKQLIKQLTEDTTPTQSPVLKPPLKPRPLPLDLTKRFTSERSSDPGSLSEATDRNDISRDPQARNEEAAVTPSDQLNQASPDEGAHDGQMFGSTPKDCAPGRDVQKVRASLFENVVERHSVMMMTDDGKAANKETDSPRSPLLRRESSNEGTLVTATYKEPVSPSSPLRVLHAFDTVQAVDESRAVSEIVPSAQREDKAMTLRSRRSEGNRPVEERKTESGSAVMPEQQPRYLRVGALPKWTNTGLEQYPSKEPLVEGQVASDTDRDRQMDAEQDEAAAAPKRLKMLQADEQPKPRATYFALTGQMQEPASPSTDAHMPFDDLSVRSVLGSSQGKILPVRRNPSLDEAFAKSSDDQVQDSIMKSHVPHEEMRSAFNRHVIEDDGMMETEKKRELKKEAERHRAKMKELEREKQRQLELEKEGHLEFERMKERERQREHERQRQKAFEREKQEFEEKQRALELQRQMELENQRLQELERERHHRQLEKEKRRELERQRKNELEKLREQEKESQREQERQRQREEERQRELDRESQLLEIQKEKQRMEELERQQVLQFQKQKQKERERMQVIELERQRLKEKMEREEAEKLKQMALEQEMLRLREIDKESERQREMEREKQRELERKRQKELDRERQELENQRLRQRELEKERQRKEEAERVKEMERRQLLELEKQKQAERERQQILELEKQRLREKMERENADKMRLIAKQQEAERQRLREKMEREEAEKLKQMALEQEMLRLRELDKESERQREMEREKQRELERKRQKELDRERQRQLDIEMQELENQRLRQREQEKERQRKEEAERVKEMERRQLLEFEKQAERERQQILELEKQRLREKMERENADKMRLIAKQQEAERQRLREKQRIEEQERAAFEASALRLKVADESSPQRSSPSTRWKEPSPRAEELYRHGVFDKDFFTSHAQLSPGKDLFPVSGIQNVDAGFGGRSQPSPERDVSWKVPAQTSVGFSSPVWTTSPQDPWELRPVDAHADKPVAEPRNPDGKLSSPEQLLLRLHEERVQASQRNWSAAQDEPLHSGPFAGTEAETSAEPLWHPTVPQAADSRASIHSHRRSQGAQELNRMRSRSVSRRSAPSTSVLEGSLSRMRSRSAHREQDSHSREQQKQKVGGEEDEQIDPETPVRETDSQYGTWETGLRTDDSLTPATPSSESTLSPSPRKPTPPDTLGEPSPLYDTVDSLPPSSSAESQPFSFPDVPVTLLDTSALRSRAHLGKKRAPRSRPTRTALQSAAPADEWLYRDSTEPKAEVKDEESDSEEPTRGAEAASAVASQPQRIAMFPGMDPSVLKAQLRKRGDSDNQTDGPASSSPKVSRSPKSPFLPRAARVLPPPGGKENGEEESPQWLKELKSKKRLSQYENES